MASLALVFDLIGRDVSASKTFKNVGDSAEQAGKKAGGFGGSVSKAMGVAAGAIAAVGVGKLAGDFVGLAANAEQSMGGVQAVFKGYADAVTKRSKEADTALGLSANSYRELATVIGSQLKNAGVPMEQLGVSTDKLISQGADLAAMFGGTTQEAVDALSSALKGEMDPIEKYGISLNDAALKSEALSLGLYNGKGNLDANAKAMAVMSLVSKQGADSIGAFGREAETASGKQARATAQFENMRTALGEKLLPIFANVMGFLAETAIPALGRLGSVIGDRVVPVFKEITGGIIAFAAAWKYNDGEVTSSGFPGFMERVGYAARQAFDYVRESVIPTLVDFGKWVQRNADIILPFVAALGAGYVVFQTITAITKAWAAAQAILNAVMAANPIGLVIVAVAALVAGLVVAYQRSETFREIVDRAFRVVAEAGRWMWENVLRPAFTALVAYVTFMWQNIISPYFTFIGNLWRTVADGIMAVWRSVISPALSALVAYVQFMWDNVLRPYFGFISAAWQTLGSGIATVYNNVIRPIWGFFSGALEGLKTAFQTSVDAIGGAWDSLRSKLETPVRAVIGFVNDKVIDNLNKVTKVFGLTIPNIPGFAAGGYTGDGGKYQPKGIVHAGEFVFTKEQTAALGKGRLAALARDPRTGSSDIGGPFDFAKAVGGKIADGAGNLVDAVGNVVGSVKDAVGDAVSWTGDKIGDLVAKGVGFALEKIIRPVGNWISDKIGNPFVRDFGKGVFNKTADAARKWGDDRDTTAIADGGGMGGGSFGTPGRGGPLGGNWASLFAAVKAVIPQARLNSGARNSADAHGRGKAVDFGFGTGPGGAGSPGLASIARYLYQNFKGSLYELIYTGLGGPFQVKSGRDINYNAATRAGHRNHVHAALYDSGGILPPGYTLAYNGTGKNETIRTAEQESALSGASVVNIHTSDNPRAIVRALRSHEQQRAALAPAW